MWNIVCCGVEPGTTTRTTLVGRKVSPCAAARCVGVRSFVRSKDAPRSYVLKGITSDAFFFQQTAVVSAFHQRVIRHSFCSYLERIFPSWLWVSYWKKWNMIRAWMSSTVHEWDEIRFMTMDQSGRSKVHRVTGCATVRKQLFCAWFRICLFEMCLFKLWHLCCRQF